MKTTGYVQRKPLLLHYLHDTGRGRGESNATLLYLYLQLDIFFDIETLGVFFVWLDLPCPCQVLVALVTSDRALGQYRERP